jgi:hypothetical protein
MDLDKINSSLKTYFKEWDSYIKDLDYLNLTPTSVGWKVKDIQKFNKILSSSLDSKLTIQSHIGLVDHRYIASIVLSKPFYKNISVLKLMQRRPGSTDPVGLDHVDFYSNKLKSIETELNKTDIKWEFQSNEAHKWISLFFNDNEAKFFDHTVIDVAVSELKLVRPPTTNKHK